MESSEYSLRFDVQKQMESVPRRWPFKAFDYPKGNIRPLFYEGPQWKGKETRIFAWIGLPEGASRRHPVPGVVLIHGGGGTALANWVRLWNEMGYAAISMDTCGGIPSWNDSFAYRECWPRHKWSGPKGWGCYSQAELPANEQWMYHAVASVLRGTSLLRSLPEVDAAKIGATGISWGGFLTCAVACLTDVFRFAIPVYGCGYRPGAPSEDRLIRLWEQMWNPADFMMNVTTPLLFVSDAEDVFELPLWQKSVKDVQGMVRRSLRIRYVHDHTNCWKSKTIPDFAHALLNNLPLPDLTSPVLDGNSLSCQWKSEGRGIARVQLLATRASGLWNDRYWREYPVVCNGTTLSGKLPEHTTAAFFSVVDDCGSTWSSDVFVK